MKNIIKIKNSVDGFDTRRERTVRIGEPEVLTVEITQYEKQKENQLEEEKEQPPGSVGLSTELTFMSSELQENRKMRLKNI